MAEVNRGYLENGLRVGWYIYWQDSIYQIVSFDSNSLQLELEQLQTGEQQYVQLENLLLDIADEASAPVFAPSLDSLEAKCSQHRSQASQVMAEDLPMALLQRADRLIHVVQLVEAQLAEELRQAQLQGRTLGRKVALENSLQVLDEPISLASYYRYLACYQGFSGDRGQIAASFRRKSFNQSRLTTVQQHFIDSLILRFYARQPRIRPATLHKIAVATRQRTQGMWIDPQKCSADVPQDLVTELLNPDIPMTSILDNPEKKPLFTSLKLPSRSWLYGYLHWFEQQPEQGKTVMTARYGKEVWEREQMVFDTFVTRAAFPLQYVFADHWLLDVFIVDEATRQYPVRLWLTVLLDAYSRCVLGMALLDETPCIESIQQALQHAIWPKTSHQQFNLGKAWICYGIPQQLSLDNAWAHHSHSLENLARLLSQNGEYNSIDLLFRPPYKGRYGALVERFFGNLSQRVKEHLPGAIQSSLPQAVRQAAGDARLLYTDIERILHQLILEYQHTPHRELNGLSPHEKWVEGMAWHLAYVPPQTQEMARLFWRLSPQTRVLTNKGIHAFGMSYWSPDLQQAMRVDMAGKQIRYRFRYNPQDISRIALFRDGHWLGDIEAKELRQTDGSVRPLSLWERDWHLKQAREADATHNHWLDFVHEMDTLSQQRYREQKRIQQQLPCPPRAANAQTTETALETNNLAQSYADYTDLLTKFMETKRS